MNILILLIGGNSIANYALIEYFKHKKEGEIPSFDKVVLIYTDRTESIANNIKLLQKDVEFEDINLKEHFRNLKKIKELVLNKLKEIGSIKSIHLNYTGATKPMSIGSFLAVQEFDIDEKDKIYSDISPETYKLTLKRGTIYPKNGSLLDNVGIKIKEFYLLNNLQEPKLKDKNSEIYEEKLCSFLLEKCLKDEEDFYEDLWDLNDLWILSNDEDKREKIKKENSNRKYAYNFNWKESLKGIIDTDRYNSKKKFKKLQRFIKSDWLEEYLFATLNEIRDIAHITDLGWNVEAKNRYNRTFELDVVATKGYNIYVFSCTTDKKAHIKQKAFEADIRAEQIGGIGAKPILVSLADSEGTKNVKDEMHFYAGKKSFDALGTDDIKDNDMFKERLIEMLK